MGYGSDGTEMMQAYNEVDLEQILDLVGKHDETFDREDQSTQYKEKVFYFRLALSAEEEEAFECVNLESYVLITGRHLY